jgi:acetate CoA/acetoacetate CoA-transferase alpha subunit
MKTVPLSDAVAMIPDGARIVVGGFLSVGTPDRLMDELVRQKKRDLTLIANDTDPETQRQMMAGETSVELVPQGTLIERIRAGGYGLGGILTPTGVGTLVEEGKQKIDVDGTPYLLEKALKADFALVHAFLADYLGNLAYALTARNYNPIVAMAGDTVIATAEHIVPVGVIAPDHVVTPAPLVDYIVANG